MSNPLERSSKQLKQFLYSQYFSDGFRITLGVILPSLVCYYLDLVNVGITLALGALCVSVPDNPGPADHRRNAMLVTSFLVFFMALITGVLTPYTWALALFITVSCFVFTMLNVFGARAAAVGVSALIVMVLGIDLQQSWQHTLLYAGYVFAGGFWYFLLSLFSQRLMPYRPAEQTLGECMIKVGAFMRIKAGFYNNETDIDKQYKKLLEEQVVVHQYQESVRDILFRTRKLLRDTSPTGRRLLLTFVDLVDLYEQIMATHYNYSDIRKQFSSYNVLPYFEQTIIQLSEELENIGTGLHNHSHKEPIHHFQAKLVLLKQKIDEAETNGANTLVLKRILINIRNISVRIQRMYEYETKATILPEHRSKELTRFVPNQSIIDFTLFRENISLSSNHFRHSVRMALICLLAFIFTKTVSEGQHSYWILLTIIVILKPGYSLTKQRNYERVIGTIAGGIIGLLVLYFVPSSTARFVFMILFMLLAYSFTRIKYVLSVLFMTPYVLIVFSFTSNLNDITVAWERIIDTFIGATAAISASYFILPSWESYQLKPAILSMLQANANYLKSILERNSNHESQSAYRLARKEIYVQTANLTAAFQRMLSEPKHKQQHADELYRFVVLNHQLSSYFATLSSQLKNEEQLSDQQFRTARSGWYSLKESYEKNGGDLLSSEIIKTQGTPAQNVSDELLQLMLQTTNDIRKIDLKL
jgi:uncharacterized membrane protein (TIGR01666 family)